MASISILEDNDQKSFKGILRSGTYSLDHTSLAAGVPKYDKSVQPEDEEDPLPIKTTMPILSPGD